MAFNAGVVVIALQGVFDEEDVLKQGEQSLADLVFVGTATIFAVKEIIDSTLGGELRSEVPNVVVRMREEVRHTQSARSPNKRSSKASLTKGRFKKSRSNVSPAASISLTA